MHNVMWGSCGIRMMVLFWAVVIVAIVLLIRWLVTAGHPGQRVVTGHSLESALDILETAMPAAKSASRNLATCTVIFNKTPTGRASQDELLKESIETGHVDGLSGCQTL
jgi:hypothetical protein